MKWMLCKNGDCYFFLRVNGREENPLPDYIDRAVFKPKLTSYKFSKEN